MLVLFLFAYLELLSPLFPFSLISYCPLIENGPCSLLRAGRFFSDEGLSLRFLVFLISLILSSSPDDNPPYRSSSSFLDFPGVAHDPSTIILIPPGTQRISILRALLNRALRPYLSSFIRRRELSKTGQATREGQLY